MNKFGSVLKNPANRRMFLQNGMIAAGAATVGSGLLPGSLAAFKRDDDDQAPMHASHKSSSLPTTRTRHVGNDPNVERYDPDLWTDEFVSTSPARPTFKAISSRLPDERRRVPQVAGLDAREAAATAGDLG
jgi:hypothetical protein